MNSQVTLVGHDASSTLLYFAPDDMKNSTISLGVGGQHLYTIESNRTTTRTGTRTGLRRVEDPTPFAVVERRAIFPDKLALRGVEPVKLDKWLRHSGPLSIYPITLDIEGDTYFWRLNITGELSLYSALVPNTPIAWYQCSKTRVVNELPNITAAHLVLKPDALPIQDMVVLSFIILEHKSRRRSHRV
ncbi:hypothetical protein HGRIS_010573 [Hohenbuehelia grisea]|uniref:DUF6593 domain-containing protein n=1 Tax=Hohenbuehelia grisea TaxID=104357 RepID=A0ABR3IX53_9AGAR